MLYFYSVGRVLSFCGLYKVEFVYQTNIYNFMKLFFNIIFKIVTVEAFFVTIM